MSTTKRIVVLSTSDIQNYEIVQPFGTITGQVSTGRNKHTNMRSTGALEHCLERGDDVYVISTRESCSAATDVWWQNLVGSERVFMTPSFREDSFREWPIKHCTDNALENDRINRTLEPWRRLFDAVHLPFPEGTYGFWTHLKDNLTKHGFIRGSDVVAELQRQYYETHGGGC